jgi:hypothetical protein
MKDRLLRRFYRNIKVWLKRIFRHVCYLLLNKFTGPLINIKKEGRTMARKTRSDCTAGTLEKKNGLPPGTIRNDNGRDTRSDMEAKIKANAELVIKQLGPLSSLDFGFNAASIAWVDEFLERQRLRPDLDGNTIDGLVNTIGSFLGESIIRCYGGRWQNSSGEWAVYFDGQNAVFPFGKVKKQLTNGPEDSIKNFFEQIPVLFQQNIQTPEQSLRADNLKQLEFFIRQAEEAYGRIYDAWSGTGRAAAYSDCKESMADAIHLARELGLDDKVAELEEKLKHYKEVFQHQMNF